ncbi:Hypothetical predicted protein [Paramuricea clavata]|uniref:Uncharacterized protein n=1 Tax=Paramuricea clavata TaxID=317549 RepID=A0A6S7JUP7_PARCT|nr:Hypothetical predicted protein [Paramuricea clavata]
MYEAAQLLKHQIKQCKGISIYPGSVNDIDQATAKNVVTGDLYLFLRWLITNDGVDVDAESDCSNDSDERKVLCLTQDVIHCTSHGRVNLGLVMSVHHLTGSKQCPFSILWAYCSCYSEIETVDTALARESLAKSECDGTVIPSNITPDTFIQFAADNNDINEETLDGKDTTHATTLVVYQQKPFGPMPRKEVLANHTKKKRSLTKVNSCDEILEC